MTKDEILKMPQKENQKNDERELLIQTQGCSQISVAFMC